MVLRKMALWAVSGLLLLVGLVGCGESERSRANRERNEQRDAEMEGTSAPASATPSFMPAASVKLVILPGKVEIVQGSSGGPMILRVTVNAKQKVAFGVVPRTDTGSYSGPAQVASAMEKLKCANSGVGTLSLSCELSENDKDLVIVVADYARRKSNDRRIRRQEKRRRRQPGQRSQRRRIRGDSTKEVIRGTTAPDNSTKGLHRQRKSCR